MTIRYLNISISIHGLEIEDQNSVDFLVGWIRQETLAGLLGRNKNLFKFRNEFESDVEVEVTEIGGNPENE